MRVLVDTGVLLRAFERNSHEHKLIMQAMRAVVQRGDEFVVAVQNVAEFWNVSTRPQDRNGLDLPSDVVARRLRVIERVATIVAESTLSYNEWKRLVTDMAVRGVKIHDTRLVSVMVAERIPSLLTLNVRDFERYKLEGILVETPRGIVEGRQDN